MIGRWVTLRTSRSSARGGRPWSIRRAMPVAPPTDQPRIDLIVGGLFKDHVFQLAPAFFIDLGGLGIDSGSSTERLRMASTLPWHCAAVILS